MLIWIVVGIALYFLQLLLSSLIRIPQIGIAKYVGSRDDLPELPVIGQRASRAFNNMRESFPIFLGLAVLNLVLGDVSSDAILGAQMFVIARAVYVGTYLAAVPWGRSLVWSVGFLGLLFMLKPIVLAI
ncbi:MAPEG family protein [Maritalea sp.]|uniref:MAPEG family protein n=1 Tax=Maritalea sp. TaxID=2003361 RepID=UPI003EFA7064